MATLVPILVGFFAASLIVFQKWAHENWAISSSYASGGAVLAFSIVLAGIVRLLKRTQWDYRPYGGLSDLMVHIHDPSGPSGIKRWAGHGAVSMVLNFFQGFVGPEGATTELSHALQIKLRARQVKWFEEWRRRDAVIALSAGVAAAFEAPFAAIILPAEIGLGSHTGASALAALFSVVGIELFKRVGLYRAPSFELLEAVPLLSVSPWLSFFAITLGVGLLSVVFLKFISYVKLGMRAFGRSSGTTYVVAGVFLSALVVLFPEGHRPFEMIFQQFPLMPREMTATVSLLLRAILVIVIVQASFGTIGILWPLFAMGGFFGYLLSTFVFHGFSTIGLWVGAAAIWGGVLGAPIAGTLIAFELTRNFEIIFPCLVAALGAKSIRKFLKCDSYIELEMKAKGLPILQGRSQVVLESLRVSDAMVKDFQTIPAHEPVSESVKRLREARYPFFPVVKSTGEYLGILTADVIQESYRAGRQSEGANSPLSGLLEAKDLLYRAGLKTPGVGEDQKLSGITRAFEETPCVPVLSSDSRVVGLLFSFEVRLVYDREVARRLLSFQSIKGKR